MDILSFTSVTVCLLVASLKVTAAADFISQSLSITDNGTTLVSPDETFELGFFSPGRSKSRYIGIWYKKIPGRTVVWVANRLNPINDSNGILTLHTTGNLVLASKGNMVWNSSSPLQQADNPVAKLLNSGNFLINNEKETDPEVYLWQSFDHLTDTLLPGMKLGWDLRRGLNRHLTAWKSPDDPSPGDLYTVNMLNSYPDSYMMKGSEKIYRSGPWNGLYFSGSPEFKSNSLFHFSYVSNKDENYVEWTLNDTSAISRIVINQTSSSTENYIWVESVQTWRLSVAKPEDACDSYGICGAYGNCITTESLTCQCLNGFRPKLPQQWNNMDWSHGCVRNTPLSCNDNGSDDGFVKLEGLKLPDTMHTLLDETMSLQQCRAKCLSNCSCMAYTNSDISGQGHGCVMWFNDLIDVRQYPDGQDLFLRMPASELGAENRHRKKLAVIVATTVATSSGLLSVVCYYIHKARSNTKDKQKINKQKINNEASVDDLDLPLLEMSTIVAATANFSMNNKIGEGGFGPVYKGMLENGQEIAVKKLSRSSGQGAAEFKNEVKLIAKLQHRNLVKLLGCCIQREEKMLVYEYMPNNSLDSFIFDQAKGELLDWPKRVNIICGIARGLLYLHQDSKLRIIHRDLKPSNVLLDDKLNPKISDFGMARTSGVDEIEGNTNRVVGTYGYMAPEYASNGLFSIKSDIFSFGVLLLEIICGKRNRGLHEADRNLNLIGHAWMLWKEGKALELIDSNIGDSCIVSEALRCIHVSLLCVQNYPEDRPNMHSVILMLGSEMELVDPQQPGFFPRNMSVEANSSSGNSEHGTTNELSLSILNPR